jgi:hypothetical protein
MYAVPDLDMEKSNTVVELSEEIWIFSRNFLLITCIYVNLIC